MTNGYIRLNKDKIVYTQFHDSNTYPEQNGEYLGRKIMIRYVNDRLNHLFERNKPNEEYLKPIFKVLRWDADEENGKVILVNQFQDVIVTTVAEIMTHKWYRKTVYDDICFLISDEERASMTEEEFNRLIYSKEKVYRKSVDSEWVKFNIIDTIYIEYEKSKEGPISDDIISVESPTNNIEQNAENEDGFVNTIFRASDFGYIVKDDLDGIVVAYDYINELQIHSYRFVTDTEANFYANRETNSLDNLKKKYYEEGIGGRINIWQ